MSMLSSQRNRLLFLANELESRHFNMNEYANAMRRAADTIWELRNKLAGTVDQSERIAELEDENARLRSCLSDDAENARQIMGENAKLRELLRNALTYIEYEGCGVECPETGHGATLTSCDTCNRYETESCAYVIAQSARELGIKGD